MTNLRFVSGCLVSLICLVLGALALAQTTETTISPPSFTAQTLTSERDIVTNSTNLTQEQITQATDLYNVALKALEDAAQNISRTETLRQELQNSPQTIDALRQTITDLSRDRVQTPSRDAEDMNDETLIRLQQQLISQESELRNFQAESESFDASLQSLLQRPVRQELSDSRQRLVTITTELDELGEADLEAVTRARRFSLQARQYYRRTQIRLLEQEIASLSTRQQVLTLRRDLAKLQAQQVEADVIRLQNLTGLRRLSEAREKQQQAFDMLTLVENGHPFLTFYARGNVSITERLREIATEAGAATKKQAEARTRRDNVKSDLDIARQLTELGSLNRQSSATLRRLKNQRPSIQNVRNELTATQDSIVRATQERLWAQERLRQFPIGQFEPDILMRNWRETNNDTTQLSETDRDLLRALKDYRRELLIELPEAAFSLISEADQLQIIQGELLTHTEDLRDILNQKLLWLPSIRAIDKDWPRRVWRGFFDVVSIDNLATAYQTLRFQFQRYLLLVLLFMIAIAVAFAARKNLREDIAKRAKMVGRVKRDSYLHTPAVIVECAILAAPIPLILLLFGILFTTSNSNSAFIEALGQTGRDLSGFTWFFLTWKEWNRDGSLLDKHYSMPNTIRKSVIRQLSWFVPFGGVMVGLVTLTQNSREADVYEGLSLLCFMIVAISLSIFGLRILWAKRSAIEQALSKSHFLWRYRRFITLLVVGLPLLSAILAGAGYYDTARELLSRLFFSSGLVIVAYVTYGLIRRTVLVAQRRLALRQALERREQALAARQKKEEAEQRGEAAPPPVNYEEIDLETLSRQSAQLLTTLVVIGFAVLMWLFWQDLLPALSIFDDVRLWSHTVTDTDGVQKQDWVTLWNVIQGAAILVLTFIAARNLPGFLEVFVLNRSKLDAGSRYAIVSIVGYFIIAVGIFMAFNRLGTEWSQFQWIIAALGVGIGFGLQEIIANFISGLIILFERPVRIGDYVTIGDQSGTVSRIQIRATTLADLDNREILIPNKELITGRVTNWTLSNATTRLIVRVGVAYGSDTDHVREIIQGVIKAHPKILDRPMAQVFFLGFGDSSLDFEVRVFLSSFEDRPIVSHALHTEINKALEAANITIPFPQRDLHIVSGLPGHLVNAPAKPMES